VTARERGCYVFSMRSFLALTMFAALAGVARADESHPRSIWLECKAPAGWPFKLTGPNAMPLRLTCRIDEPASEGPAYWQTLNPFAPARERLALVDPFEVEATARLADPFEPIHAARPRAPRTLLELPSATIDPFEPNPASAPPAPPAP
jgi:hypothetical protein